MNIYHVTIRPHTQSGFFEYWCVAVGPTEAVLEVMRRLDQPFTSETFDLTCFLERELVLPKGILISKTPEAA